MDEAYIMITKLLVERNLFTLYPPTSGGSVCVGVAPPWGEERGQWGKMPLKNFLIPDSLVGGS